MYRLFALLSALVLIVSMVGCGGSDAPPAGPGPSTPTPMPTTMSSGPGPGATPPAPATAPSPTPEAKPEEKAKPAQDNSDNPFANDPPRSGQKTVTGAIGRALKKAVGAGGSTGKSKSEAPSSSPRP